MDVYGIVTERIIQQMEQGIIPWHKPWVCTGSAISHDTGKPYSILNQMLLGKPGEWLTFKQINDEGGKVKKGEKASIIVFYKLIEKQTDDEDPEIIPMLRYYNVFHVDQCEGITAKHEKPMPNTANVNETADAIIADYLTRSGVKVEHVKGNRAFYRPSADMVTLPMIEQFRETAEYYSTAFHELVHSTGHETRLNRIHKVAAFGSEDYSREELTAEIGASALVNHAGLETSASIRNNAACIASWLNALKGDKRMIVSASSRAEKAVNLILNIQ